MSVVINEFEAVAEAAPPLGGGGGEASAAKPIKPHDLVRPSARLHRRTARIWAH